MKKLLVAVLCLSLSGCVPAVIVGAIVGNAASKKNKRQFIESYNHQNLEREKAGLPGSGVCPYRGTGEG